MDNKFIILYSKFSKVSKMYIDSVKEKIKEVEFEILCIDNKITRNKIVGVLGVTELPCVLVYKKDQIETYSGEDSYRWMDEMIRIINLQNTSYNETSVASKNPRVGNKTTLLYEKIDNESNGLPMDESNDDVDSILSTMSDRNIHFGKKQPVSIRKNAGNYEYDMTSMEDKEDTPCGKKDTIVTNGIKKINANGKKQNIVAMATAMQKSREEFDNHGGKKK